MPPARQATYRYPQPYSEEFWRLYAEPIEEVIGAARLLGAAVSEARVDDKRPRNAAGLNALVSLTGPALIPMEEGLIQRLVSPSLLGSLAVMAQIDLASGRLLRCRNARCETIVVVFSHQAAYCSPQCRYAEVKRRARRRATPHRR
ncbi:MAG: hypothetical protein A3J75_04420 [Acidobacteria bacterium RBG_16_68_9]|nr:MAG: hypothetical protein A3J75_04420 [Acidobacteria bacterium RBG_16_68_9]